MSSPPRPAATTILVRPGTGEFEVFMLRRSAKSAFMPDVYVFPGGALDPADFAPEALARVRGVSGAGLSAVFRDEPGAGAFAEGVMLGEEQRVGLFMTAARELFEEAGVLLAAHGDGTRYAPQVDPKRRAAVASGEFPFTSLLEELDAWVDAGAFIYFSHWITPLAEPRRFDAYFFIAQARPDEQAQADAFETHDGIWIAPARALERASEGTLALMFPTIMHLERLREFGSIDDLVAFARTKRIVTVMPQILPGPRFLIDEAVLAGW